MKINIKFIALAVVLSLIYHFSPIETHAEVIATQTDALSSQIINGLQCPVLNYTVEKIGKDTIVTFGDMTPEYLKSENRKKEKSNITELNRPLFYKDSNVREFIKWILIGYKANVAVVDSIRYEFDKDSKTLTVTGQDGSIYATAYAFVVWGIAPADHDAARTVSRSYEEDARDMALGSNPRNKEEYKKAYYRATTDQDREWVESVVAALKVPEIETVIIKGNVQKIGTDFGQTDQDRSMPIRVGYGIKSVDMSGSNVRIVCDNAFTHCGNGRQLNFKTDVKLPPVMPKLGMCFDDIDYEKCESIQDNFLPIDASSSDVCLDWYCNNCCNIYACCIM